MLRALDRWWFGYGSPVALGVFRILLGTLATVSLLMVSLFFREWFVESGFVPAAMARQFAGEAWRINPMRDVTSTPVMAAFYGVVVVASVLTTLGLWTRVSSIVLAVGVVSLHHRNLLILHGGDTLMRVCLIYLAIAPSGAACGVDRLVALWKGKAPREHVPVPMLGQRLVQFNVALMYLTTVWHKRGGTYWFDGTATWYPGHLPEFNRFWVPQVLEQSMLFVKVTTYGTLFAELALATLVFYKPFRKWVLIAGLAMHGFIEYRYNIPMFAFISVSTYVCFYEGDEVAAWFKRFGERFGKGRIALALPRGRRLSDAGAATLHAADPLGWVHTRAGEDEGWSGDARAAMWRMPGLWFAKPFLKVKGPVLDAAMEPKA